MQLRQYQEGHIKNNYLFHPFCRPQKHMYRGKFCIALIIRSWDKKISIFFYLFFFWGGGGGGGGGGLFSGFSWGATLRHIFVEVSKSVSYVHLIWMQIFRRQFSGSEWWFCIHEYKIRFCEEVYIPPYPNIVIYKNHVQ